MKKDLVYAIWLYFSLIFLLIMLLIGIQDYYIIKFNIWWKLEAICAFNFILALFVGTRETE